MADWTQGMKKLALQAYENSQPCDICFGSVSSASPLAVTIEQLKLTLGPKQLILTDCLLDQTIPVTVDGKKGTAVIQNALKAGEQVVLLKKSGGQKYVVLARIGKGA